MKVMVGPLSGSEGLAVKDYAKTQPDVTFVNGTSAAQDTTLRDPAPNFFRFSTEGAQWMAGLGEYAYNEKGYRTVAVLAEDYSFPYTQVFGFLEPFCRLGGKAPVDARFWVPIGNKDYSSVIAALPDDVDAIYVALGGADAINFLTQYEQAGGELPLVAGSITVDQTVLGSKGKIRDFVIGTPSAGPISDTWDDPRWSASSPPTRSGSRRKASRPRPFSPMATTSIPRRSSWASRRWAATSRTGARRCARRSRASSSRPRPAW